MKQYTEMLKKIDWNSPFCMGVFGTLKLGCGNSYLMGSSKTGESQLSRRGLVSPYGLKYESHHKAFMPHFAPSGLSISYSPGAAGVFEVFEYTPEHWKQMIVRVDSLESFTPGKSYEYGYFRTLAWLHILPDDYEHRFFGQDKLGWEEQRILPIPEEEWGDYERIPCWVYSSKRENQRCMVEKSTPVIWYGQ